MHPVLFSLPNGFEIHVYGFLIALGALIAVGIASRWAVEEGFDKDLFADLGFWCIVAGVVGGRIEYIRVNAHQFQTVGQMINVRDGGLVYYGGLIGVLVVFVLIVRKRKLPMLRVLDVMAPTLPFGIVMGRLGCLFSGCCYGHPTDLPWAITFPLVDKGAAPPNIPLHPTQLYEVGYGLALCGLLLWMRRNKRFEGQIFLTFLSLYPILRSFNELFRGDEARGWFLEQALGQTLSNAQAISIMVALVAAAGWAFLWRNARE